MYEVRKDRLWSRKRFKVGLLPQEQVWWPTLQPGIRSRPPELIGAKRVPWSLVVWLFCLPPNGFVFCIHIQGFIVAVSHSSALIERFPRPIISAGSKNPWSWTFVETLEDDPLRDLRASEPAANDGASIDSSGRKSQYPPMRNKVFHDCRGYTPLISKNSMASAGYAPGSYDTRGRDSASRGLEIPSSDAQSASTLRAKSRS